MVAPSGSTSPATSGTSSSEECPPDTSSATTGVGSGPCSSWSTAMCAARWLTAYSGLPRASAYALAAHTPTCRAPARPGPAVTAIASTWLSPTPAAASARSTAGTIASRWARLATSGTTPPNRACSAALEAIASASSSCPRTRPAPVSSQEVSMPSTSGWPTPQAYAGEPVPPVEVLRTIVVDPDLEEHLRAAAAGGLGQHVFQQRGADSVAPAVLRHPHGQHIRLAGTGCQQSGVTGDHALVL